MEDNKRSGNRPNSGAAILLNRIPLQNFLTEHNSPSWNIVGLTHQTSAINNGEGYIHGYIYWLSQSELWYDRAKEFFKACVAKLSKNPIYIPPGRFLLWHLAANQPTVSMCSGFQSFFESIYLSLPDIKRHQVSVCSWALNKNNNTLKSYEVMRLESWIRMTITSMSWGRNG